MRKVVLALALALLLPLQAHAQTQPMAGAESGGWGKTLVVTVGVLAGVAAVDLLTGGALTGPLLTSVGLRSAPRAVVAAGPTVLPPAVIEARNAGAVLGEQIVGATAIRDAAARVDMLWAAALAAGGVAGGYLINRLAF